MGGGILFRNSHNNLPVDTASCWKICIFVNTALSISQDGSFFPPFLRRCCGCEQIMLTVCPLKFGKDYMIEDRKPLPSKTVSLRQDSRHTTSLVLETVNLYHTTHGCSDFWKSKPARSSKNLLRTHNTVRIKCTFTSQYITTGKWCPYLKKLHFIKST
jgi:hypothetical protein